MYTIDSRFMYLFISLAFLVNHGFCFKRQRIRGRVEEERENLK